MCGTRSTQQFIHETAKIPEAINRLFSPEKDRLFELLAEAFPVVYIYMLIKTKDGTIMYVVYGVTLK